MTFVVDTSVLVDLLRGDDPARAVTGEAIESCQTLGYSVLTQDKVVGGHAIFRKVPRAS